MSESGDYDPGPWKGHDFGDARAHYDRHVGRSYDDAVSKGKTKNDVLPKELSTESESPLVIACDVTGSMGDWPATMFSKLPYLEHEAKEYLGSKTEISFAAVGDCFDDTYPLQARPFTKSTALKESLEGLVIEGGGGGGVCESYDLAALYYANKVSMPKARQPVFIFIGDEGLYDTVDREYAKELVGIDIKKGMTSTEAIRQLQQKFSVYMIIKPYHTDRNEVSSVDSRIYDQWATALGEDHIANLPEAGRVVDVIFGILAKESGKVDYFRKELRERQRPEQVNVVLKSLHQVHELGHKEVKELAEHVSVTRRSAAAKAGKGLL